MTSKTVPTVVKQLRIVFCPRCKSSTGMRSFLQENLPTLKRSIAESSKNSSKNPQNPTPSTTVLMIRESKGAPPQAFLKLGRIFSRNFQKTLQKPNQTLLLFHQREKAPSSCSPSPT